MGYAIEIKNEKHFFKTYEDMQDFIQGETELEWTFKKTTPRAVLSGYASMSPEEAEEYLESEGQDSDKNLIRQIADAAHDFGGWDADVALVSEPCGWTFSKFDADLSLWDAILDVCHGFGWRITLVDDDED